MRSELHIDELRCEQAVCPLGVETMVPRFSWRMASTERGMVQTAYQIQVAGSEELLIADKPDIWDSGKIVSDQNILVSYGGSELKSRQRCYWRVRIWDSNDCPSAFSGIEWWEMGLLDESDWQARWIGRPNQLTDWRAPVLPSPIFRKPFELPAGVKSARAYISGLGYYELYLNGGKVGDRVLDPAPAIYDRHALYVSYDITDQLTSGKNVVGVMLGNGWYNCHTPDVWHFDKAPWRDYPKLMCQIEVILADGSRSIISSDNSWVFTDGPIRFDGLRNGETYDARCEIAGWCEPGYDDSKWEHSSIVNAPGGTISSMQMPPCRVIETLEPVDFWETSPGVYVYDFGQNISGWAQLRVSGPEGTEVTLKYAELLNEDRDVDQSHIGMFVLKGEFQTDRYILRGSGVEQWEPRFTYHGFQYVQVSGLPGKASADTLRARVVHTSFEQIGEFECSNDLFNQLHKCTQWSYRGNFVAIPTDCPHREKNGWTGDAQLAAEMGLLTYDNILSYRQWLRSFADSQRPSGELSCIIPTGGWGYNWGNGPAWDSALLLIPWYIYQYTGDVSSLAELYPNMRRYVDYCARMAADHILDWGLGDWCHVSEDRMPPAALTSTAYYYVDCKIVSQTAALLGNEDDSARYAALAEKIRSAINKRFYDGNGQYADGEQTAQACALYQGIADDADRAKVAERLVKSVDDNDGKPDIGILGSKYILRALSDMGETELAYSILNRTDFPGWGHWLTQGATTLWESWNGDSSHNHIMFGDIDAWMYNYLAGIMPDAPGFKSFIIHPRLVKDLTWVRASHRSPYGDIRVEWKRENGNFTLNVTVPVNTAARIVLPASQVDSVREGAKLLAGSEDMDMSAASGCVEVKVGSGEYSFVVAEDFAIRLS